MLTEEQIIDASKDILHKHYSRMPDAVKELLHKEVMWIGECNSYLAQSSDEFLKKSKYEYEKNSFIMSRENYHVVYHDEKVYIVCGTAYVTGKDESNRLYSKGIRFTLVWMYCAGSIKLIHMHLSDDCSDNGEYENKGVLKNNTISIKAVDKKIYGVCPEEVMYVRSERQYCKIFFKDGSNISSRISLSDISNIFKENFIHIHRSYVVNTAFIVECKYMKVRLTDKTLIPVSRDKFTMVKKAVEDYRTCSKEKQTIAE